MPDTNIAKHRTDSVFLLTGFLVAIINCHLGVRTTGFDQVVEALDDGGPVVALALLRAVETGPDVLELRQHLGYAIRPNPEVSKGQIGGAFSAGLSRAIDSKLRPARIQHRVLGRTLERVAPRLNEKTLNKRGFRLSFFQNFAIRPGV